MIILILVPFIVQMLAIFFDEYYFHIKRGLPRWERIGHPMDTFSVLMCLIFVLCVPYSSYALKWYIGLSVFSCLMVTKDEWIHKHHCPAAEQWLHALLFLNHPIVLASVGVIWWTFSGNAVPLWLENGFKSKGLLYIMLLTQSVCIALFFFYQIIYWNFLWKEEKNSL